MKLYFISFTLSVPTSVKSPVITKAFFTCSVEGDCSVKQRDARHTSYIVYVTWHRRTIQSSRGTSQFDKLCNSSVKRMNASELLKNVRRALNCDGKYAHCMLDT